MYNLDNYFFKYFTVRVLLWEFFKIVEFFVSNIFIKIIDNSVILLFTLIYSFMKTSSQILLVDLICIVTQRNFIKSDA